MFVVKIIDRQIRHKSQKMEESVVYTVDDDFTVNVYDAEENPSQIIEENCDVEEEEESQLVINLDESNDETKPDRPDTIKRKNGTEMKCESCGFRTHRCKSLKRHEQMHKDPKEKLLTCKNCDYQTFLKGMLSLHMARCVPDLRKYKCPHCTFHTLKHRNLKGHIANVHDNEKKSKVFRCKKCSFVTDELTVLKEHRMKVHDTHKQQVCNLCGFITLSKVVLHKHMKTHEVKKEKIFQCDLCDYESRYSNNVVRHREKHMQQ